MAHYQITLAYDGTDFQGFQRQGKARTVQAEFEVALRHLNWQEEQSLLPVELIPGFTLPDR